MRLEAATRAAREAGEVLRRHFGQALDFRAKADGTFVSRADEEAEAVIRQVLRGACPHDAFIGEESGASGSGNVVWHVDPLDGTANFMHGIPSCAVSIGLEQAGDFVLGVVYDPFADTLLSAERGSGAFAGGQRLRTSAAPFPQGAHVVDAEFLDGVREAKLGYVARLSVVAPKLRMIGSNVLQLTGVARGLYVSSYSDTVHSWDIAAGVVLVTEAGGAWSRRPGIVVAASSPETLDQAMAIAGASSKNPSRPA